MDAPYEPFDPFAADPDGSYDVDEYLASKGWEGFLGLGDGDSHLRVQSWRRYADDGTEEYMITASDLMQCGPYLKVRSFPDLMDLLARWAPAVQAAGLVGLIDEVYKGHVQDEGLVETIAARALYGVDVVSSKLRSEQAQRRRGAVERQRVRPGGMGS